MVNKCTVADKRNTTNKVSVFLLDHNMDQRDFYASVTIILTCEKTLSSLQVEIVDEFGCSLYPSILPHVSYEDDLSAGLPVHAFSLDVDQVSHVYLYSVTHSLNTPLHSWCRQRE